MLYRTQTYGEGTTMTTATESTTRTDWLATAKRLSEDFATRAAAHDADDSFVAENYAALREAKFFSAPIPTELGGGGATFAEHAAMIRILARGCGSTALAYSMHSHPLQTAIFRHMRGAQPPAEPLLRRIAKEELVIVTSGGSDWLDGSGTLVKNGTDYTFSARKIFSSGSPSGDVMLTTGIYDDPEKGPTVFHFGVNMHDPGVKVQDTWHTMGMRGTGSHDVVIEGVKVPDASVSVRRPKGKWHPAFDVLAPIAFSLVTSAYLGVAEAARDLAVSYAQKKRDDAITVGLIGEMDTQLLVAQDAAAALLASVQNGFTPSVALSDITFKRKTTIANALTRAVYLAMEVAGGASFFRDKALERHFRDIQGIRFHPLHERRQQQFSGRVALGLDPV
jgi:alkylation response protein AidB-like acyl-CoA dehydrogenase